MKELPPSAPYQFTFNSRKRGKTYIINQLLERTSTQLPQAKAERHKNKHWPLNMKLPVSQISLFSVSGMHTVGLVTEGKCESSFPCFNTKDNGWLGGSLHFYFLPPVFHPVNGTAIPSGRRQQMVLSVLNGLLVSKAFVATEKISYLKLQSAVSQSAKLIVDSETEWRFIFRTSKEKIKTNKSKLKSDVYH